MADVNRDMHDHGVDLRTYRTSSCCPGRYFILTFEASTSQASARTPSLSPSRLHLPHRLRSHPVENRSKLHPLPARCITPVYDANSRPVRHSRPFPPHTHHPQTPHATHWVYHTSMHTQSLPSFAPTTTLLPKLPIPHTECITPVCTRPNDYALPLSDDASFSSSLSSLSSTDGISHLLHCGYVLKIDGRTNGGQDDCPYDKKVLVGGGRWSVVGGGSWKE